MLWLKAPDGGAYAGDCHYTCSYHGLAHVSGGDSVPATSTQGCTYDPNIALCGFPHQGNIKAGEQRVALAGRSGRSGRWALALAGTAPLQHACHSCWRSAQAPRGVSSWFPGSLVHCGPQHTRPHSPCRPAIAPGAGTKRGNTCDVHLVGSLPNRFYCGCVPKEHWFMQNPAGNSSPKFSVWTNGPAGLCPGGYTLTSAPFGAVCRYRISNNVRGLP